VANEVKPRGRAEEIRELHLLPMRTSQRERRKTKKQSLLRRRWSS